jgi:hypothetical protein
MSSIRLEATSTHLLLFVPFSENARAKSIDGRRWEPTRKGWAYPRTAAAYDAIIAEVGDELAPHAVQRPKGSHQPKSLPQDKEVAADALRRENEALRGDLQGLKETVEKVLASTQKNADITALQRTLLARESEIAKLRVNLAAAQSRIQELELAELKLREDIRKDRENRLKRAVERVKTQPMTKDRLTAVRHFVETEVGAHSTLPARLQGIPLGDHTSLHIGNLVEKELRARLGAYENHSFHQLINQAADTEVLSTEGRDFAHTIRKERNNVAHDNVAKKSYVLRGALSLVCMGLLWSDFG